MKHPFVRLLALLAPFKGRIALAICLGVATVVSGIGLLSTSAYLLSRAALHPSIAALEVAIVGVRFFGIARGVFRYLERYVSHGVTFRLLARLRVWLFETLEPLAPARLLRYRSGDLFARIVADVETLEHFFVRVVAPPVVAVATALLTWGFLRGFDSQLANAVLMCLLVAGAGLPFLAYVLGRVPARRLVTVRAELATQIVDSIHGMADLVAFGQEQRQQRAVRTLNQQLRLTQRRMAWISGLHSALSNLLVTLATLAVLLIAIPLISAGRLDGVFLAVLVLATMASFEAVLPLPAALQHLESSLAAAVRLFDIVDAVPEVVDPTTPAPVPGDYTLEAEQVCFRYQPHEPNAIDGVSFRLPQGNTLAIVGPSGSGKSTLTQLFLRFWDPQTGRILLGGRDVRDYAQDDLRRVFSVVSQRTHLFNTTVRANLLVARPGATEAELIAAARQAQLHDVIERLPQGYDTWIGEQGVRLSGGERQRLALARAILKDAPILILDEPTANLDPVTERHVLRAIAAARRGRTTLLITHRLVEMDTVDEILVVQRGIVVERGRHAELLRRDGFYRHMWDLQRQVISGVPTDGTAEPGVLTTAGNVNAC